jgi:hypothetical protein
VIVESTMNRACRDSQGLSDIQQRDVFLHGLYMLQGTAAEIVLQFRRISVTALSRRTP